MAKKVKTVNLGLVAAIRESSTEIDNKKILWRDSVSNQMKYFDYVDNQWKPLGSGGGGGGGEYIFNSSDTITSTLLGVTVTNNLKIDTQAVNNILQSTSSGVKAVENITDIPTFSYNSATGVMSVSHKNETGAIKTLTSDTIITGSERVEIAHSNRAALDLVAGDNKGDETQASILAKLGGTPIYTTAYNVANGVPQLDGNGLIPVSKLQDVDTRKYTSPLITNVAGTNTLTIDFAGYNEAWVTGTSDGFVQSNQSTFTIETLNTQNAKSIKLFLRVIVASSTITFPTIFHPFDTDSTENIYKSSTNTLVFKTGYYEIGMDFATNKWILKAIKVAQ
jgi:hypothetical protein